MTFPANNLPTASRTWGREVEKKVTNLEGSFRSAEVNNVTRDSQLSVTANAALSAATQAQVAADEAEAAAIKAQQAIDGLGSLDESTSTFKINAANITVGNLSGNRISGGEIVGTTLKTAATGRRVELQSTSTAYFDENNNFTGRIIGAGTDRGATLELTSGASGEIQIWNGGAIIYGAAGTYAALSDNGFAVGGNRLYTIDANIEADGNLVASGSMSSDTVSTGGVSCSSVSSSGAISGTSMSATGAVSGASISATGDVSGASVSATGAVSAGSVSNSGNYTGNGFPTIAANLVTGTTTFAPNVFISASTNNMARNTTMSERRAKENIQELEFNSDAFISINPVTFNYKREAVSDDEQAEAVNLGFILDDFEDAGLGNFLVAEPFEGDEYKQLRYNLLYMYLHKVVQEQNSTIKDLTARIQALESR